MATWLPSLAAWLCVERHVHGPSDPIYMDRMQSCTCPADEGAGTTICTRNDLFNRGNFKLLINAGGTSLVRASSIREHVAADTTGAHAGALSVCVSYLGWVSVFGVTEHLP